MKLILLVSLGGAFGAAGRYARERLLLRLAPLAAGLLVRTGSL